MKTGNVPPDDFVFAELRAGEPAEQGASLNRCLTPGSILDIHKGNIVNGNPYQQKKELEKKIKAQEEIVQKLNKESSALKVMVDSYVDNPAFGNAQQFTAELDSATCKLGDAEAKLLVLKAELASVNRVLDSKWKGRKGATSQSASPSMSLKSNGTYGLPWAKSFGYDDDEEKLPTPPISTEDLATQVPPPPMLPVPPPAPFALPVHFTSPEAPPVPIFTPTMAEALYNYEDEEDGMTLEAGERVTVVTPDENGWTGVKSVKNGGEGFVPTSYLKLN